MDKAGHSSELAVQRPTTLCVVRHSEAEATHELGDHARTITARGKQLARELGAKLAATQLTFDHVLCSDAVRAVQTLEIISSWQATMLLKPDINNVFYRARTTQWLDALRILDDKYQHVLIVGHEPVMSILVSSLSGTQVVMPPCCTYMLTGLGSWQHIESVKASAKLLFP